VFKNVMLKHLSVRYIFSIKLLLKTFILKKGTFQIQISPSLMVTTPLFYLNVHVHVIMVNQMSIGSIY